MKSRAFAAMIAVLLVAGLSLPALAQDNPQSQTSTQASSNSPDQSQPASSTSTPAAQPASSANGTGSPTDTAAATAPPANAPKDTHSKGKTDIDDIGDRNVGSTGRSVGNWYSIDTDIKVGKQYAMMVEQSARMIQDPVINEYVNRVGQNLVRNSDAKVPFTIKVVDSDDINAFALPGGFFYVNSGLILAADNEAELAGVMAHEISHVILRHATREMTRSNYVSLSTVPLMFVIHSWGVYEAVNMAMSLALPVTFMKFSRDFEGEADYFGLQYMYKAGYDPQAFIAFFEKIQALEKQKPGALSKAFASHPQTPERILKSQQEIRDILPARPEYIEDTSEFDEVKARLAAFENGKKAIPLDKQGPTLRRTQTADSTNTTQPSNGGDDRPTLQRRDDDYTSAASLGAVAIP
ncbi:MAG: M48 family metallopeptidase [Candidatus Korobacteraceae bacterium]